MRLLVVIVAILLAGCSYGERSAKSISDSEQSRALLGQIQAEPISRQNADVELGAAVTPLSDDSPPRVENINIACGAINATMLPSGASFSFNAVVGRRTPERGYADAKIIVNGRTEIGCGGGVCQAATTLYMAAVNAKLQIDERHPHSKNVLYAPQGSDATVVWGEKDLKFTNNTEKDIVLYLWVADGRVFSKIIAKST